MKTSIILITTLVALCAQSLCAQEPTATAPGKKPRIEVCFVLDTTGSMSGLIEGAKQKIWSIANEMISAKPTPELKLSLIGYRDKGDEYVIKSFPLTDDIDALYSKLQEFRADGGGDTPEAVNEALSEAINNMAWSKDRDVLKIIFLVGDAPPHMDYPNSPKYPALCRLAMKKDLIINTVQCGDMAETTPIWKEIAKVSEGSYAAIAQSGNMAAVETPMDKELAELNRKMGETLIPYGDSSVRREVRGKQMAAEAAAPAAAADRLSYNVKTRKSVQGAGELLDSLASNQVELESIDKDKLPEEMQKLGAAELEARITKAREDRTELQKKIEALSKQREEFIRAETRRLAAAGNGDSFDENVAQMIRRQAEKKGISYGR
jgi:Mg-chelatase subunit ChlD